MYEYLNSKLYTGKGLSNFLNIGNSCYFNATLYALLNCLGFVHPLLTNKISLTPELREKKEHPFLVNFMNVIASFYQENQTILPKTLYNNLSVFCPRMTKGTQHDAHECLIEILNLLHVSMSYKLEEFKENNKLHTHIYESRKVWYSNFKDSYSMVTQNFFGQYIQKSKCLKCNSVNFSYQPFVNLSMSIPQKDGIITIDDIFRYYFKKQTITKNCEAKCKETTEHTLKSRIINLPQYLIVHFKRFDKNNRKLTRYVGFGSDTEISKYCIPVSNVSYSYDLVSVVNHTGNCTSGHYYTYNRLYEGNWVELNDDNTKPLDNLDVCTNNAYILIFSQQKL